MGIRITGAVEEINWDSSWNEGKSACIPWKNDPNKGKVVHQTMVKFLKVYGTDTTDDVLIFYCHSVHRPGAVANGAGYAFFPKTRTVVKELPDSHMNNIFIGVSEVKPFTPFHEIGHVLTNDFHFGTEYSIHATPRESNQNLMRKGTNRFPTIGSTKRIYTSQETLMLSHPALKNP